METTIKETRKQERKIQVLIKGDIIRYFNLG